MAKKNSISTLRQRSNLILQNRMDASNFHTSIKFSLQLAQFFGIFPIYVGGKTYKCLKIKWCQWRMFYFVLTFLFCVLLSLAEFYQQFQQKQFHLETIYNIQAVTKYVLFFKLCLEWPDYVKEWQTIEIKMKKYELCSNMRKTLTLVTSLMISIATVEHMLINLVRLKTCFDREASFSEAVKLYFVKASYSAIFDLIEFSLWRGLIFEFIGMQMAFMWNFSDVFIMLIGLALKFKLHQITKRIQMLCRVKIMDKNVWSSIRKDYVQLSQLCDLSNNRLSYLIIVSYSTNLYFVLRQLFSCLRPAVNYLEKVYLLISFALLILRLTCICIFGSKVHDEWKNICFALQSVQSTAYNPEVDRFVENAMTCELVLTGKNFFKITRGLVLKIAGSIVTYELVIIQFSMDTLKKKLE